MSGPLTRLGARLIRSTTLVDSGFRRFDQLRSILVTRAASDEVLDAYNDLIYGASQVYRAGTANFRAGLFNWEAEVVDRVFPPPPGTVLIGGAGGGREVFALADRGYDIVAFEPSPELVRSIAGGMSAGRQVEAAIGRYEDLPILRRLDGAGSLDLRERTPFRAALFGWTSFAHLRHRAARVAALRAMGALTEGPVVLSFYLRRPAASGRDGERFSRRVLRRIGAMPGGNLFSPHIGVYHLSAADEIEEEVRDAGLTVAASCYEESDGRWPWIVARINQGREASPARD